MGFMSLNGHFGRCPGLSRLAGTFSSAHHPHLPRRLPTSLGSQKQEAVDWPPLRGTREQEDYSELEVGISHPGTGSSEHPVKASLKGRHLDTRPQGKTSEKPV